MRLNKKNIKARDKLSKNIKKYDIKKDYLKEVNKKKDEKTQIDIIQEYSPLVVNIAKRYHNIFRYIEFSELIAEGNRGLLEAIKRYKPQLGAQFSTYAWFWIVKNIREYIDTNINIIGIPRNSFVELRKILDIVDEHLKRNKNISLNEIAKKLGLSVDTVRDLLTDKEIFYSRISLDKHLDEDSPEESLSDLIEDKRLELVLDILDRRENENDISEMLKRLEPIEAKIIRWRFGFGDNHFHSLKEVGKKLRITSSKVKDIESIALNKLKRFLDMR